MSMEDIDTEEVIIKTATKEYVFKDPSVQKIRMQGQETFQVVGSYEVRDREVRVEISDEDIATVMEQAGVSREKAKKALIKAKGDLAQAIVNLTE